MKNKLNLVPLLLLAFYFLFMGRNENIAFEIKLIALIVIAIFSSVIVFIGYKDKTISKSRIIMLLIFIGISLASLLWSLQLL